MNKTTKEQTKSNPSSSYQHLFNEIPFEYNDFCMFDSTQVLYYSNQDVAELQDQLMARVLEVAPKVLTDKQYLVFKMYFLESITTTSIAKELKLNTSTIQQRLYGFKKNGNHNVGVIPQLRKALAEDEIIVDLLAQIQEAI